MKWVIDIRIRRKLDSYVCAILLGTFNITSKYSKINIDIFFLKRRGFTKELKVYSVSDDYIEYLRKNNPYVYSNKVDNRKHTRKYIGIIIELAGYNYFVPMSSPKETDYQIAGKGKVIKKSIVPIIRIVVKNNKGEKELKGRHLELVI